MIKKDYIERLTQDIARFMAKLIGFEAVEALEYIDESYQEYLHLDKAYIDLLTTNDIVEKLEQDKKLNIFQIEMAAEMMYKEGELLYQLGERERANDRLSKALTLFEHVEVTLQILSLERQMKISKIKELLNS